MKASSESGLWALTISRESTDVIKKWSETHLSLHQWGETSAEGIAKVAKEPDKSEKGGHLIGN
jgi:hypothetical protein